MLIPPLPPAIDFEPLPKSEDAIALSFAVKRVALGPYIIQRWGWDELEQHRIHRRHFAEKPFWKIARDGQPIGTLSLMQRPGFLRFGEFYIVPSHQRQGLGSGILAHCLELADKLELPVRLEHLKWNPVGSLYRRHGFEVVGETHIHWLMERNVGGLPET